MFKVISYCSHLFLQWQLQNLKISLTPLFGYLQLPRVFIIGATRKVDFEWQSALETDIPWQIFKAGMLLP